MKRFIAPIMLMALTVFSVVAFMTQPARADIVVFTAQLLASNEVPPVSNADANAFGNVTVTLDTTANTARFDVSVNQVASPVLILSHIHEGVAGVNGPIRVDSGLSPANPVSLVNGSASFTRSNLPVATDVRDRLLANPAGFYFNVHSSLNPGGVVRGQLVRATAAAGVTAPTLSQWGAILMTLLFIAACTFFLVGRSKPVFAADNASMISLPVSAIDWRLLVKVALNIEVMIALVLLALRASMVDVFGALASGLPLAYIVYLMIASGRKK